jgi:hypothetical protein
MVKLTGLPRELRQQILLLALPNTNRTDSHIQVLQLFHINHIIRQDMAEVLKIRSPLRSMSSPGALPSPPPPTLAWTDDRICLDLFHSSPVDRTTEWPDYCGRPRMLTNPEHFAAWADAVPLLPDSVKQVWLDVTPAPGSKRKQHPLTLNRYVHNKGNSEKFLLKHVGDVAALVGEIDRRYGGRVEVVLTGTVSQRSDGFLMGVDELVGRELEFQGTVLRSVDARFAKIVEGVRERTSTRVTWHGRRQGDKHPLVWLCDVSLGAETAVLFAQLVHEFLDEERMLLDDVFKIAGFRADFPDGEGELVLPPTGNSRRKFQHFVAEDLSLKALEVGEGGDRHVVVSL